VPIFPTVDLRELELGREVAFFRDHRARRGPDEEVDGAECGVFELTIDGKHLSLFIDLATKAPRMLRLRAQKRKVTLRYRRYERRQAFDPSLFAAPKGIPMAEDAPAGRRIETPFDDAERGRAVDKPDELARSRSVDAAADHSDDLRRLRAMVDAENDDALEAYFSGLRKAGGDKEATLIFAYAELALSIDDRSFERRLKFLQRWIRKRPRSITPRVALIELWRKYAWAGRGMGAPQNVGAERWKLFYDRLENAEDVAASARELKEKCPMLYFESIRLARDEGVPLEKARQLLREAEAQLPGDWLIFASMPTYWSSNRQDIVGDPETFLESIVKENPGGRGAEIVARLVASLLTDQEFGPHGEEIFQMTDISWPLVRDGYRDVVKRSPDSKLDLNYFAFLACAAGDKKTAREIFARIGAYNSSIVWGDRSTFLRCRRWASS